MTQVRLPRLLDGDLNEVCRLNPSQLTLTLNLSPPSNASMVLPEGEPSLGARQYVELYTPDGSAGIYRVTDAGTRYGEGQDVSLEHAIITLADDLTDADKTLEGNMTAILSAILKYQTVKRWTLGTVEATESGLSLDVDRHDLLDALLEAVKLVNGYALELDQSVTPWKIHLRKLSTTPSCECRISRNIENVEIRLDDQDLCTRVYAKALPNGYLDADTVDTWGVVSRTIDIPDGTDAAKAKKHATDYMNERKNPNVSVEIDAQEMAQQTGESIDIFTTGALCRLALPDWGVSMDERLISKRYNDLISAPESVRLSLSTLERNLARLVAQNKRSSGGASRTANKAMQYIWEHEGTLTLFDEQIELLATEQKSAIIRLNGLEGSILLKADKIDLEGYVTIGKYEADRAEIDTLLTGGAVIGFAKFGAIQIDDTHINSVKWHNITIGGTTYSLLGAPLP